MRKRSEELDLSKYDTDKIANGYLRYYDSITEPWIDKPVKLLEIGVFKGGSLKLWRDYFPHGAIAGIDAQLVADVSAEDRIQAFEGVQTDPAFLSRVAATVAPEGFDIIIDDASHVGSLSKTTFWHLFDNHLKTGGLYVVEDWGTGYFEDWQDGRAAGFENWKTRTLSWISSLLMGNDKIPLPSHDFGMVGFVKQLVDEQGATDLTRQRLKDGAPARPSKFARMTITPSIVFVQKA